MSRNRKPVLQNTCLCAIVRDEVINPAGGIANFVEETVPYVEGAVILDTGSVDGTKLILEEAELEHPNLWVFHLPFRGYAESRNDSLRLAREHLGLRRALVLDADERLSRSSFDWLASSLPKKPNRNLYFDFFEIYPDGIKIWGNGHRTRIFLNDGITYTSPGENMMGENERLAEDKSNRIHTCAIIEHYVPDKESRRKKMSEWYNNKGLDFDGDLSPSQVEGFEKWKQPHPDRKHLVMA